MSHPVALTFLYRNTGCPGNCHATGGASQQAAKLAEALVITAKPGSHAILHALVLSSMFVSGLYDSLFYMW